MSGAEGGAAADPPRPPTSTEEKRQRRQRSSAKRMRKAIAERRQAQVEAAYQLIKQQTRGKIATPFDDIQEPNKRAYLIAYSIVGRTEEAADIAGINRSTPFTRQWKENEAYQRAFETARELRNMLLDDEIFRRGVEGIEEPTGWYKGEPGGYVRRFSDNLLMFMAKAEMPAKYGDRLQLQGTLANLDVSKLPDHLIARIAAGENVAAVLADGLPAGLLGEGEGDDG